MNYVLRTIAEILKIVSKILETDVAAQIAIDLIKRQLIRHIIGHIIRPY